MAGRQHRRIRGNMIAPRLNELLTETGSRQRLLAKLHLLGNAVPELADLSEMRLSALSQLTRTDGVPPTVAPDKLVAAIAYCLGVCPSYLMGLRDDPRPPADFRWPWDDKPR